MSVELLARLIGQLLVGFAVGVGYFAALRRTVMRFTTGKGRLESAALTAGRIGMAIAVFAVAARLGCAALLLTLTGFLTARTAAVYRSRGAG